jgi:hypothetical protein
MSRFAYVASGRGKVDGSGMLRLVMIILVHYKPGENVHLIGIVNAMNTGNWLTSMMEQ